MCISWGIQTLLTWNPTGLGLVHMNSIHPSFHHYHLFLIKVMENAPKSHQTRQIHPGQVVGPWKHHLFTHTHASPVNFRYLINSSILKGTGRTSLPNPDTRPGSECFCQIQTMALWVFLFSKGDAQSDIIILSLDIKNFNWLFKLPDLTEMGRDEDIFEQPELQEDDLQSLFTIKDWRVEAKSF